MNAVIAGLIGRMVRMIRMLGEGGPRGHWVRTAATSASLVLLFLSLGASHAVAQEVVEYYGTDALGSVRVVFAPDGTVKARSDYLPFGEEYGISTTGGPLPTQRFAGGQRDAQEDLDYFQHRSYQTRTGRFITVDPIYAGLFEPQRWNRYTYALANPLKFVDPDGLLAHCETDECVTVTAPDPGAPGATPGGFSPFPGSNGGGGGYGGGGGNGGGGRGPGGGGNNNGGNNNGGNGDNGGDGDGGDNGNSGQTPGGNTPPPPPKKLPAKVQKSLDKATEKVKTYKPSASCQSNVIDRLPNFNFGNFQSYLGQGANYYDGTSSAVPMNGAIYGGAAGNSYARSSAPQTVSAVFQASPGTNAMTSITAPNLTVYVRPSTVNNSNGGDNSRNRSLVFHEGLHGYTRMDDYGLQSALQIPTNVPSGNITQHIAQNCK
jgi:RHS repeat-associated protein